LGRGSDAVFLVSQMKGFEDDAPPEEPSFSEPPKREESKREEPKKEEPKKAAPEPEPMVMISLSLCFLHWARS